MVIKGVNKRVIIIKNPDSEIFEEVYFIVKNEKGFFKHAKENDMITEANRIIADYSRQQKMSKMSVDNLENEKIEKSDKSEKSDRTHLSDLSDLSDKLNNPDNINKLDKTDRSEKAEKSGNQGSINKSNNKNDLKSRLHSMSHLSDDEIFEDEKFFDNIINNRDDYSDISNIADFSDLSNLSNLSGSSDLSDLKNYSDCSNYSNCSNYSDCPDYYAKTFDRPDKTFYYPQSLLSADKSKFKLVSSKKINKFQKYNIKPPSKGFFAGIGFMSAIIIAIRVIEFIFSR